MLKKNQLEKLFYQSVPGFLLIECLLALLILGISIMIINQGQKRNSEGQLLIRKRLEALTAVNAFLHKAALNPYILEQTSTIKQGDIHLSWQYEPLNCTGMLALANVQNPQIKGVKVTVTWPGLSSKKCTMDIYTCILNG